MRKHKVLDKPFREHGRWWSQRWLYEKLVEVEVPNDDVLKSLLQAGKIAEAAELYARIFVDVFTGRPSITTVRMTITRALLLDKGYNWKGAWTPVHALFTPIDPNTISIYR